jgi:transcriptional regulator with XRE-family HTH domain
MTIPAKFGSNMRQLRRVRGISQEELAERSGLHRTYIGGIERGERNPSLINIVSIAEGLSCNVGDLFKGLIRRRHDVR